MHDEALLALRDKAVNEASFRKMVHKVKGGAQLLSAKQFTQACEALDQAGSLDLQIDTFIKLLEEQNHLISRYESRYAKL